MPADKTEQIMVRLTPELLGRLKAHAAAEERAMAQVVRMAIRSYLDAAEEGTPASSLRWRVRVGE